jgi:hypothetical protein
MSAERASKVPGGLGKDRTVASRSGAFPAALLLTACLLGAVLFSGLGGTANAAEGGTRAAAGASGAQQLSLYAVAAKKAFVNNTDDLARGEGHNPFGNYSSSTINTKSNEKVFGPFAGDMGVYSFALYSNASKKHPAGSAIFICQYGFDQNAFCDLSLQLKDGTLIGKGELNFNSKASTLAIIGGTSKYRSVKGVVDGLALGSATQAQPVHRVVPILQAQRLDVAIHPA